MTFCPKEVINIMISYFNGFRYLKISFMLMETLDLWQLWDLSIGIGVND